MPRKRQGGPRQGAQGSAYGNRTDLNQGVRVATGQPYGQASAQEAAQRAVPLPAAPRVQAAPPQPAPAALPGAAGPFTRATERPGEPLTAGLSIGPGPGPEAVVGRWGGLSQNDQLIAELKGLYGAFPSDDIARLLDYAERRGR